jgi:hypothetical protein
MYLFDTAVVALANMGFDEADAADALVASGVSEGSYCSGPRFETALAMLASADRADEWATGESGDAMSSSSSGDVSRGATPEPSGEPSLREASSTHESLGEASQASASLTRRRSRHISFDEESWPLSRERSRARTGSSTPSHDEESSFAARFVLEEAAAAGGSRSGSASLKKLLDDAAVFAPGSCGANLAECLPKLRLEALLAKKAGQAAAYKKLKHELYDRQTALKQELDNHRASGALCRNLSAAYDSDEEASPASISTRGSVHSFI